MGTPKAKSNKTTGVTHHFGIVHHSPLELLAIVPAALRVEVDSKARTLKVHTDKIPALFYFEATDKIPSTARVIDADSTGNRIPLTSDVIQKCLGVKL